MGDLYILGAGFSRALSSAMPLMPELSGALSRYETTAGWDSEILKLIQNNFESGLSYLAENKPFLTASENLRHQHLLLDITRNLATHLGIAQARARQEMADGGMEWVRPLIAYWINSRAEIITLNYDTLVEELAHVAAKDTISYRAIYPTTIAPAAARGGTGLFLDYKDKSPVFRLHKLHGSLNWYHSEQPGANTDTVYFVPGHKVPSSAVEDPPESVSDKGPFIVPPVPAKGSLIHHDTMRAMWRDAAKAVKSADRIFVLGYSMPVSDTLFVQLIRGRLFNKKPTIEIVDLKETMCAHVTDLLSDEQCSFTQRYSGASAIPSFVNEKAYLLERSKG